MRATVDHVDAITQDWERIHPDIDIDALNLSLRLIRAGRILQTHLDAISSRHGFAVPGDYEVLAALRRSHPEPLQPTELADRLMITTSGMTGRLDRLEQAGLIQRHSHPNDRRATSIEITHRGIAAADGVFTERLDAEATLFKDLGDAQQRQIADLLRIVLAQLGDQPEPRDGPGNEAPR